MQQGNFINVLLARHVLHTQAHHQEHWMLSCSVWFSAPSFWMGGGLESRCVGRVYGADGAVHGTIRTVHIIHTVHLVASSWHFKLFHEEDARSNNPQV